MIASESDLLVTLRRAVMKESREGTLLVENPYDNPICKLSYNAEVLCIEVAWQKYATSLQLRYIHEIILQMLAQHGAEKILGDDTNMQIIHAEDQHWIAHEWLPRARANGLRAVATKVSETFFGRVAIGIVQSKFGGEIQIKNFSNIHSARSWLTKLSSTPTFASHHMQHHPRVRKELE